MTPRLQAFLDRVFQDGVGLLREARRRYSDLHFGDLRVLGAWTRWGMMECGEPREAGEEETCSLGIRVFAGEPAPAPGFWGGMVHPDPDRWEVPLQEALERALERARANARLREAVRRRHPDLGTTLQALSLAPVPVIQDRVPEQCRIHPTSVSLEDIQTLLQEASQAMASQGTGIRFYELSAYTQILRWLYANTEGSQIEQRFAFTQAGIFVVAQGTEDTQELYEILGHQRGWETLVEGDNVHALDLITYAREKAREALALASAPALRPTEKEVVVVTDPEFNALLVHEILGHPTEADRVLKYETAYAGRSWFFRNFQEHWIGRQVASPLITAYSDPSLPGYGHYRYDHEGTPGRRVVHIRHGILQGFMNSRQTAALLGQPPNGSWTATDAAYVPLVRMSTTVIAPGNHDPQQLIREVDDGYYLCGMRTPSISESRENFAITARKVYRIRRGELGELYRNGGITADSHRFLLHVDGVGTDFRIYPIPNCGKGQPMQTKRLGNGGPTLRSRARLIGGLR